MPKAAATLAAIHRCRSWSAIGAPCHEDARPCVGKTTGSKNHPRARCGALAALDGARVRREHPRVTSIQKQPFAPFDGRDQPFFLSRYLAQQLLKINDSDLPRGLHPRSTPTLTVLNGCHSRNDGRGRSKRLCEVAKNGGSWVAEPFSPGVLGGPETLPKRGRTSKHQRHRPCPQRDDRIATVVQDM